jgi:arylsulfatase
VRLGDWKGLRQNLKPAPNAKKSPDLAVRLYNLRTDPAETTDVAAQHPEVVKQMTQVMRTQHTPSAEFPFPVLDKP